MKQDKTPAVPYDYRRALHSPYLFHMVGVLFAAISGVMALFLPSERFLLAPGILGDKWGVLGLVVVLLVIQGVNFAVTSLVVSRDKVLFWVVSAASAAASAGVLIKVASIAYFW